MIYLFFGHCDNDFINNRYSFCISKPGAFSQVVSFPIGLLNNTPLLTKYIEKKLKRALLEHEQDTAVAITQAIINTPFDIS